MKCPTCKKEDFVVKKGFRYNRKGIKQRWLCNHCRKSFTPDDGFLRMRSSKEVITEAIDLFRLGLSLAKTKLFLILHHSISVSRQTILNWVNKFSNLISNFVKKLLPAIATHLHVDEVFLKLRGQFIFYWHCKDRKTKFKVAAVLSKKRSYRAAKQLFATIKKKIGYPLDITTDKLGHYKKAFNKFFYRKSKLIHSIPIAYKKHGKRHNNNCIERENREVKQRFRLMLNFNSFDSAQAILELLDTCHNFIDPCVDGKTTAEKAGIKLKLGKNKLLGLIKFASSKLASIVLGSESFLSDLFFACSSILNFFS